MIYTQRSFEVVGDDGHDLTISVRISRKKYLLFGPIVTKEFYVRGSCTVWHYMDSGYMVGGSLESALAAAWTKWNWSRKDK